MAHTPSADAESENWVLCRVPREVQQKLAASEVNDALAGISPQPWRKHPVDIRISLPLPFKRYYITIVAGPERRSPVRRAADRHSHRLASLGNALFMLGFVGVFYALIIGAAMLLTVLLA